MFPGAIVCSLERRDMPALREPKNYVALEKTDGVRYLLLLTSILVNKNDTRKEPYAILIDRKMQMRVVRLDFPASMYDEEVLFDGELAQSTDNGLYTFLIFDLIYTGNRGDERATNYSSNNNNNSWRDSTYTYRMRCANLLVRKFWRKHITTEAEYNAYSTPATAHTNNNGSGDVKNTFALKVKRYVPLFEFQQTYRDVCERGIWTHHGYRIDGFIFVCARQRVEPFRNKYQFKWKPADRHTIDVQLMMAVASTASSNTGSGETVAYNLYAKNTRNAPEFFQSVQLCEHNRAFLQQHGHEIATCHETRRNFIVECAWDSLQQCWLLLQPRPDKQTPNAMHTIEKTRRNIQENITLDEIAQLCRQVDDRQNATERFQAHHPYRQQYQQQQQRQPEYEQHHQQHLQEQCVANALRNQKMFVHPSRQKNFASFHTVAQPQDFLQKAGNQKLPTMFGPDATPDKCRCVCDYCLAQQKISTDSNNNNNDNMLTDEYDPERNWQCETIDVDDDVQIAHKSQCNIEEKIFIEQDARMRAQKLEQELAATPSESIGADQHHLADGDATNVLLQQAQDPQRLTEMLTQLAATLSKK